ncbi:GAF and ANTAR domain-containing protein [Microbacterium sp. CFBP9034]|uniref:GAF and ANTAR domain-containing protein n=1 Tax=Microbacterium sp. CFBP9034 TaxID=3096540 RepID=UPI002A6A8B1E|nr:GAF and ANTAR domain-containing protein [Microbacterium sp. CFBP9034]MDY0910447.1 GAF and ANTAR domain-containing protein [Microbacterium sp. CFBP9034]
MTVSTRSARLFQTFATLADTLVDDYDVVELLQTLVDACHDTLGSTAAGILIADEHGELELVASTSEASRLVEIMQLSAQSGPCIDCFVTGAPVSVPSIAESPTHWAEFRTSALSHGFASVEALPLRLRDTTIGTLNLLSAQPGPPPREDVVAAQAFADVATVGILHERSLRETALLAQQLQLALNSRVVIEQAKGVVSFTRGVPVDDAFELIRDFARRNRLPLSRVAAGLVSREIVIDDRF